MCHPHLQTIRNPIPARTRQFKKLLTTPAGGRCLWWFSSWSLATKQCHKYSPVKSTYFQTWCYSVLLHCIIKTIPMLVYNIEVTQCCSVSKMAPFMFEKKTKTKTGLWDKPPRSQRIVEGCSQLSSCEIIPARTTHKIWVDGALGGSWFGMSVQYDGWEGCYMRDHLSADLFLSHGQIHILMWSVMVWECLGLKLATPKHVNLARWIKGTTSGR